VTDRWSRALELAAEQLLAALVAGTAAVCLLAALVVLWDRVTRIATPGRAYYVGRRDAHGAAVYFVARSHVARLAHVTAFAEPAWGAGAHTEALAAVVLRHHTGRREPSDRQVSALGMWLEIQPEDGFVLESAELGQIVGGPLAGRRRLRPSRSGSDPALRIR
jgi:hypothetical protein